ncbi:MAG TPA: hypothetical protein VGF73_04900 [Chthoniobacterales bacterium]|jgi:mRNA-degrading endonuclease RelE of RelBE toxin-antitoxin system
MDKQGRVVEQLKAEVAAAKASEDAETDEKYEVEGNQPVRLIQFPKGFLETLERFPKHASRATMNRLGRLAAGEPGAFQEIKQLKAYPGVLRARVSDKYRLLFCLEPDHLRVLDLIRRADLDDRIERLKKSGLPAIS